MTSGFDPNTGSIIYDVWISASNIVLINTSTDVSEIENIVSVNKPLVLIEIVKSKLEFSLTR